MAGMAKHDDIDSSGSSPASRRQDVRLVVLGVAGAVLVWFALANLGTVSIDFWLHTSRAPLILVILVSGLLGALIATLVLSRRSAR
jgi:uncharacterized integral membrane protein